MSRTAVRGKPPATFARHRDLAEVATRCDRHADARAATATALALYEAKENVAAAAQLRARAAEGWGAGQPGASNNV